MKGPLSLDIEMTPTGKGEVPYVRPRGTGGFVGTAGSLDTSPELNAHPEVRALRREDAYDRQPVLHIRPSEDPRRIREQLGAFAVCLAWYDSASELAAAFIRDVLNLEPESVPEVWTRYAIEARAVAKARGEVLALGALPVPVIAGGLNDV